MNSNKQLYCGPCKVPIEEIIIIIALQRISEKVGYECDSMEIITGLLYQILQISMMQMQKMKTNQMFFFGRGWGGVGKTLLLVTKDLQSLLGWSVGGVFK